MELLGCVAAVIVLAIPVLALLALVRSTGNQRRISDLEGEVSRLRVAINALRERLPVPPAGEETAATSEEIRDDRTEPLPAPEPPPIPSVSEPITSSWIPEQVEPEGGPVCVPSFESPPSEESDAHAAYSAEMHGHEDEPPVPPFVEASEHSEHGTSPPPPPPPPPLADRFRTFDWESLVGVKLFSWIAGIALALAAVFFLKYSFEQGLLQPPVRMAIGMITGIALLVLCELRVARQYHVTANALDAAGIAILYATLFSSNAIWHLLPSPVTFALMILVTIVAVILSIRRESVFIALLGLIGGFATPALLSSGEDRPISLFTYLLIMNAGLAWVAYKKRWPVLAVLALIFTTLYQWGWVVKFLGTSNLPLAVAIFLAFPLLSVGAFLFASRKTDETPGSSVFGKSAAVASIIPLTFAIYLAAVPAYGERHHLLFMFLVLVDLGLAVVAATRRAPEALHTVGAISTVLVVAIWIGLSYSTLAWPSVLVWIAALVGLYLATPLVLIRLRSRLATEPFEGVGARAVWAAPLLLFLFPVLAAIEPSAVSPFALFGTLFLLVAAVALAATREGAPGTYHLAALLAILAEIVWTAKHLGPETLHAGLTVYAAFALLFIAVPAWMSHKGRPLTNGGGPHLLASFLLLFFLAGGSAADVALPGIALLLVIFLAGLYLQSRNAGLITMGLVLSWIVLQTWWSTATLVTNLIPALVVLAGLSLLILAGGWWLRRSTDDAAGASNIYLALVGHLFLIFVASRVELAVPPWPLFAILALLTLAIAAVSHLTRSGGLLLADVAATQLVLIVWAANLRNGSWPAVAFVAILITATFGFLWREISGRADGWSASARRNLTLAAFTGLFLGQIAAIVATRPDAPSFALVFGGHLALLCGILVLSARADWHIAAVLAVVPASMAMFLYPAGDASNGSRELAFGSSLYLALVAYPLALGRRVANALEPYLAPILMSVTYFFFAREWMVVQGLGDVIGILPIAQAAILAFLLYHLLRIEPPGERTIGRLALVAGVALAFVTVAIPLQLDREWITIGWALEGAALVWLYRRVPHRGLLWSAAALLAVVFIRLTFNTAVLEYHPRSETPILNWYLYTYLVSASAMFMAARLLPGEPGALIRRLRGAWAAGATILLFLLLNIEIADFYSKGSAITFDFNAGLAQDLTYTLGWAVFAILLLVTGLAAGNRPARIAAIGLLLASVLKGFLHDLMRLGGLYRIASLVGLAIALALVAILLQKFVLSTRVSEEEPAA